MSKRKKTREQKIIADLHRKLQSQSVSGSASSRHVYSPSSAYTYKTQTTGAIKPIAVMTDFSYIKHDLIKTTLVTCAIVLFQLALFHLLRSHIIMIPMVRY
jgi:hypothetical protein